MVINVEYFQSKLSKFWDFPDSFVFNKKIYMVCVFLLLFYAAMKISFYDFFKLVEPVFILLGLYVFFRYAEFERTTLPVNALWAAIAIAFIVWFFGYLNHPELIRSSPKLEHLARHFIFIFIAYLLAGSEKNASTFWFLAAVGLMFSPWTHGGGWLEILQGLQGKRITFGIQNWQHTGILFGLVTLGLLVFFKRFVLSNGFSGARFLVWSILFLFSTYAVFASQTRSVFLAFFVILGLVCFCFCFYLARCFSAKEKLTFNRKNLVAIFLVLFFAFIVVVFFLRLGVAEKTYERFSREFFVIEKAWNKDFDAIPNNSIGSRIHSWRAASEWFVERPILGWGSNGGIIVMRHTEWLKGNRISSFGHLHSSYVETAIRYGLLGIALFLVLSVWVARKAWSAWRNKTIPNDYYIFMNLFFVFWVVVNFFESYMYYWTGVYVFNIIMSVVVSFIWKDMRLREKIGTKK